MKALIILATIVGSLASAYNTRYYEVQFSRETEVQATAKETVVSLSIESINSSGKLPNVSIVDEGNCSHKQTLISYSGFDLKTKTYKRIYEVQINRDPSKRCYLAIYNDGRVVMLKAARVNILPSK